MHSHRLLWIFLISVLGSTSLAAFKAYNSSRAVQVQEEQKRPKKKSTFDDLLTVDFDATGPIDPEKQKRRKKHGKKYDSAARVVDITEPMGAIFKGNEFYLKDPFPIDIAEVIVVAEVTEAEAVLSDDRSGVYTEFTLLINEVLKDDSQLKAGDVTITEREGGKVKMPSGNIVPVVVSGIGVPKVREKYLLFLKRHPLDQALVILTGYGLSGDAATALDDYDAIQAYNGASVEKLLVDLKGRLSHTKVN